MEKVEIICKEQDDLKNFLNNYRKIVESCEKQLKIKFEFDMKPILGKDNNFCSLTILYNEKDKEIATQCINYGATMMEKLRNHPEFAEK